MFTLFYLFMSLPYYVETNFLLCLMRLFVLLKTKPYQMPIHNTAIYFNSAVLIAAFAWLVLEEYYLLSPPITKTCSIVLLGCLGGVLALATVRTLYNVWFKYKGKSLDGPEDEKNKEKSPK